MPLAAVITRLVALWILVGAVLKLLLGSPADLPQAVKDLPLEVGTTFAVAIAAELAIGAFALLRPSRGWLPLLLLLAVFLAVLGTQIAAGDDSCGCFGAALVIAPEVMLGIDGGLLVLLLISRPWRLVPGRGDVPFALAAIVAVGLVALPVLIDREAKPGEAGSPSGLKKWAELELEGMEGRKLADTKLHGWLGENQRIEDGIIVIWRASCEVCADHLRNLAFEEQGDRDVVLLELPKEFEDEKDVVKQKPEGGFVFASKLPDTVIWDLTPPVHIEVVSGTVTKVLEGMEVLD